MSSSGELEPPKDTHGEDPGAHQLAESSESEDQFTDAQSAPMSPSSSPVPKTRIEKVDEAPSYGESPGTEAYRKREADAEPDEIAVVGDESSQSSATTPGGPLPETVLEEAGGGPPSRHSEVFESKRKADASPDRVVRAKDETDTGGGDDGSSDTRISPAEDSTGPIRARRKSSRAANTDSLVTQSESLQDDDDNDDNDGDDGDDFDDFEEGEGGDEDFDDFEDGFQQAEPSAPPPIQHITLPFPVPDFDGLNPDDITSATEPYLASLFPPEELEFAPLPPLPKDPSVFSTPRSASLWSQLVAPPPLAPPDWIRSRTRRLFLVSLGVPVDLDEILPASKQKKLVLPSLNLPSVSPRTSSDSRSLSRLRQGERNASSTSVDTQGRPKKRKGPPPQPDFDMVAARHLCKTTDEALDGMTDEELQSHVKRLEAIQGTAKEVLEYWTKRTDEKIGDREAFEGVIENLVKHARKVRK